jgi:3-oxoacyl-[acyl-carrier-protein] synthase-3
MRIAALGTYLPQKRLTNADLSRLVDTDDAWIVLLARRATSDGASGKELS